MGKVKFNIKNVHYAIYNEDDGTYGVPVHIPGTVSLSLEQQGELSPFYADGIKYYTSVSNGGYQGDLVNALIPDSFRKDVLGEVEDNNKVLFENSNTNTVVFALGFQIDGNNKSTYFWFYNCTATRPSVEATTNEEKKTPNTDTLNISCAANADGLVRTKTTPDTPEEITSNWFKDVYIENKQIAGA